MRTGELDATPAAREAAKKAGLEEPATFNDMARQLLDLIDEKMPAKVSPYDGMLGLYFARSYLDLYLATGNKADLVKARRLAEAEAERYAQLVRYASALDPHLYNQLGRSESYALQYLGEAVALRNYAEALSSDAVTPEDKELVRSLSLEDDLNFAQIVFIDGFTLDEMRQQIAAVPAEQRGLVAKAIGVMEMNQRAGIDPMAYSRELMDKYNFTSADWAKVLR